MKEKKIMPKEDLRKLQLIELEMLLEVDRICRENKIRYMISSGTLLEQSDTRDLYPGMMI